MPGSGLLMSAGTNSTRPDSTHEPPREWMHAGWCQAKPMTCRKLTRGQQAAFSLCWIAGETCNNWPRFGVRFVKPVARRIRTATRSTSLATATMPASFFNKDFKGKRSASAPGRNLPGQYQTQGFSALSAGPTPLHQPATLAFHHRRTGRVAPELNWETFNASPEWPLLPVTNIWASPKRVDT